MTLPAQAILFLDIDGVLAPYRHDDPEPAERPFISYGRNRIIPAAINELNRIVRDTRCSIVLTSAWRYLIFSGHMTIAGFTIMLRSHGAYEQVNIVGILAPEEQCPACGAIDPNPHDWRNGAHVCPACRQVANRGAQVSAWLKANGTGVGRYHVIDDRDDGIAAAGHPLTRTSGRLGLLREDANQVIAALGGEK